MVGAAPVAEEGEDGGRGEERGEELRQARKEGKRRRRVESSAWSDDEGISDDEMDHRPQSNDNAPHGTK